MIDFTNYKVHPEKNDMIIFHFDHQEQAACFEQLLVDNHLFFEKQLQDEKNFFVYYAVKKIDFTKARELNDLAKGQFRKPFISDKYLRYTVLTLFFIFVGLAFVGFLIAKFKN